MTEFAFLPLLKASWETLYMVFMAGSISIASGLILGSLLFASGQKQLFYHPTLYRLLGLVINITRSVPFIILMIAIIPFTRFLIGTTIGTNAAIVPLTIAAIPFFARVCENALAEVPHGLIEAADSMGATTMQIIVKILIPESLPSLIRGSTLTIIALIGYSAMAGVVGGGGLGELAINYGYQRFDILVMVETVIVLIILVQLVQGLGDFLASLKKIKKPLFFCLILWVGCLLSQWVPLSFSSEPVVRVGIMSGWPEKVMETAQKVALKEYHLRLKIVTFNDYVQPNTAVINHSIDANIFQHIPYLEAQVKAHHYRLSIIGKTFVYPMGFYSLTIKNSANIPDGAIVAIPNDPSNGARALLLLEKYKLIKLKSQSTLVTLNDIQSNPLHLRFKMLDVAQIPRVMKDVDIAAITNDFIGPAGLSIDQAILKEDKDSPYANIIVIREEDKDNINLNNLVKVMHSEPVVKETEKLFPNGAAIPAW